MIEKKKTIHGYLHTQKLGYNQLSEPNNDCNGSKEWIIIDKWYVPGMHIGLPMRL